RSWCAGLRRCSCFSWPWRSPVHARDKARCDGKFGRAQTHRFLRRLDVHAVDFEKDAARLDLGHPIFGRALAGAHAHFGGLLRHRHVREHADPHAARTLHVARDGAARGFDLARGDALRLGGLQAVFAEVEQRAALGGAVDAALVLLSELCAFGLKHGSVLLLGLRTAFAIAAFAALAIARTLVGIFSLALFDGERIVLHDFALEDPDLHAASAIGRLGSCNAVIDIGAQRVQRYAAFAIPFNSRD